MDATELYLCSPAFDSLAQIRADRRRIQRDFAQGAETEQAEDDVAVDDEPRVAADAPAGRHSGRSPKRGGLRRRR